MWTEKYRPRTLDEVVDHEGIVERLKHMLEEPRTMPHLLFAGPPGNGKTTVALCIARHLFGERWEENTLELNASDERGIGVVRGRIKTFSRMGALGAEIPFRLVILDECDELTADAQTALRRIMETYSGTCRFILICNYSSKIIEPIQSRCAIFRFSDLKKEDVAKCLRKIAKNEGVELTRDGINAIWEYCGGDLRRAINILQGSAAVSKIVTEREVAQVVGKARPSSIKNMLELAFQGDFTAARDILYRLLWREGIAGSDILRQISRQVYDFDLTEEEKAEIAELIGEYDFRLAEGASEDIQLCSFLARLAALKR